jgi:hypothetical protein
VCQQWLSIVGLVCDIVGFLIIAFEWRFMFWREYEKRQHELHADFEKYSAELRGEEYQDRGLYTMAREFSKLLSKEGLFRRKLFYVGVVLVVLGFIGQVLGSWPQGIPLTSFRAC